MDILHLIDSLEELFNESRAVPFTNNVVVDEERMLEIIDQMRVAIPEEVKKAQQIVAQRDRILAQAQEEASRTVALAREKADQMTERDAIVKNAQGRAEQILAQARADADATRADADEYVLDVLTSLETDLNRVATQVRNGIRSLETDMKRPSRPVVLQQEPVAPAAEPREEMEEE
jgi:regulator of protease activity HflC (stomatin/prohibitin superfamily)